MADDFTAWLEKIGKNRKNIEKYLKKIYNKYIFTVYILLYRLLVVYHTTKINYY